MTHEEAENLAQLSRYSLSNSHFYCETADLTRPFPSSHPVSQPCWEFVWNRWLASSVRSVGLKEHCPQLLQVCQAKCSWFITDCTKVVLPALLKDCPYHPGTPHRDCLTRLRHPDRLQHVTPCGDVMWNPVRAQEQMAKIPPYAMLRVWYFHEGHVFMMCMHCCPHVWDRDVILTCMSTAHKGRWTETVPFVSSSAIHIIFWCSIAMPLAFWTATGPDAHFSTSTLLQARGSVQQQAGL